MSSKMLKEICVISQAGANLLKAAMEKLNLSARACDRILKVSRTIAILSQSEDIKSLNIWRKLYSTGASTGKDGRDESLN